MKTTIVVFVLFCAFGYGCYRRGYSDAASKAAAGSKAEYGNDSSSDLSIKHSVSYSLGYTRGHGDGYTETRQKDFFECGEKLAQLAVETGNPRIAGRLLADGDVSPAQLENAASQFKQKHRQDRAE